MEFFWNYVIGAAVAASVPPALRWLWKMARALASIDDRLATLTEEMKREFVTIGKRLDEHETRLLLLERDQPEDFDS